MKIYTIGHSNHPIDKFLTLLERHNIACIADVRSVAASRFNPQFNKKSLSVALNERGIEYLHFQEEFGARMHKPAVLNREGQVDFESVAETPEFKKGLLRLAEGTRKGFVIALMCSEADPLTCHRFGMISPHLAKNGFETVHIGKHGELISQGELEAKLTTLFARKLKNSKDSEAEKLSQAYRLLNKKIGFKP